MISFSLCCSFSSQRSLCHHHLESLVGHVCNYRAQIWSERFPSLGMKRLAIRYAFVSICLSFLCMILTPQQTEKKNPLHLLAALHLIICLLAVPLISFCSTWNIHVLFSSSSAFLHLLLWRKEDGDACGCISVSSSKVYMAHKAGDTLGEMGVRTFEIH